MCGISGIQRFDGRPVAPDELARMRDSTRHRGPDDEGTYLSGSVGLAHNRLSILDLSPNGHQPMSDDRGELWIVFNGEVYNYREVRKDLESLGHVFRSTGDTEVVLHAYREWGRDCLARFNGMFAFAILDVQSRRMFCARDRLGIKPFYYFLDDKQFVFASEIKAILRAEGIPREIRREALPELVAFRYLSGDRTLFKSIRELEPGCYLDITPTSQRMARYWDISFDDNAPSAEDSHWYDGFEEAFRKSVKYQLISDVPVGCALSGGVDSSLVTAFACESTISAMKTFSIGFSDAAADERAYAQAAAAALGVENHVQELNEELFFGNAARLTWHMDQPINHPNSIGIWLLARLARERVTVLLTGEGGDELFGGYHRFRTVMKYRHFRNRVPGSRLMAQFMPERGSGRLSRFAREMSRDDDALMIWSSAYLPSTEVSGLLGPRSIQEAEIPRRQVLESARTGDPLRRHLYLEQKTYLPALLKRADKMTMAVSLECRVPFLDHHVVEYAARVPNRLKVNRNQGKVILFTLAERRFGADLFRRPKSGFGMPRRFFQGKGFAFIKDLLTCRTFKDREILSASGIERLLRIHESGEQDLSEALWLISGIELWARMFIDRPGECVA